MAAHTFVSALDEMYEPAGAAFAGDHLQVWEPVENPAEDEIRKRHAVGEIPHYLIGHERPTLRGRAEGERPVKAAMERQRHLHFLRNLPQGVVELIEVSSPWENWN